MTDIDSRLIEESRNCLLKGLKYAFPSIVSACRRYGSKNPYEDGQDVSNDLYIKFSEKLLEPKKIKINIDSSNNSSMEYEEIKGRAKPEIKKNNQVNVVQGKLMNFIIHSLLSDSTSFKVEKLETKLDKKENEYNHIINKIGHQEILLGNTSAKPNPLNLNIFSLQYSIVSSAKNKAQDLFSNKNIRNKMHDDIVTDTGEEIQDLNNTSEPVEEKIIEDIDKRRKMKEIRDYMSKEMDPRYCQLLEYHLQGISDQEIAKLMDTSHGNIRKMLYKVRIELAKKFKDKN